MRRREDGVREQGPNKLTAFDHYSHKAGKMLSFSPDNEARTDYTIYSLHKYKKLLIMSLLPGPF